MSMEKSGEIFAQEARNVLETIHGLCATNNHGIAKVEALTQLCATHYGYGAQQIQDAVQRLMSAGKVFEPRTNQLKVIPGA